MASKKLVLIALALIAITFVSAIDSSNQNAAAADNSAAKNLFKRGITEWRFKRLFGQQQASLSLNDLYDITLDLKVKDQFADNVGIDQQSMRFKLLPIRDSARSEQFIQD